MTPDTPPVPTTLSALLLMAVEDAEQIAQDQTYTLDMERWYHVDPHDGRCHVCMAGAVMARRLGAPKERVAYPWFYDRRWARALEAVNEMRVGKFQQAYGYLFGGEFPDGETSYVLARLGRDLQNHPDLATHHRLPWDVYRDAAARLQEAGL